MAFQSVEGRALDSCPNPKWEKSYTRGYVAGVMDTVEMAAEWLKLHAKPSPALDSQIEKFKRFILGEEEKQ